MVPIFLTQINLALTVNTQAFNFSSHVTLTLSPFHDMHFCVSQWRRGRVSGRARGCPSFHLCLDENPRTVGVHKWEPAPRCKSCSFLCSTARHSQHCHHFKGDKTRDSFLSITPGHTSFHC